MTYRLPGEAPAEIVLAAGEAGLAAMSTSGNGVTHERMWGFSSQLGGEFREDVELEIKLVPDIGVSRSRLVSLGNDAPELVQVSVPADEVVGVAVIDMLVCDSSGDVDLVLSQAAGITWVLQTSPGVFEPGPVVTDLTGDAAIGDLDGDGDLDLAVGHSGPTSVSVCLQSLAGQYEVRASLNPNTGFANDVELADVDGDGTLDLISTDTSVNTLSVFYGDHRPDLTQGPTIGDVNSTNNMVAADQGDLDGDGDLDLVRANPGMGDVALFLQTAPRPFEPGPVLPTAARGHEPNLTSVADFGGDGDVDGAFNSAFAGFLVIYFGSH